MKTFEKLEGNYYTFKKGTTSDSNKYNDICKDIYTRIFTRWPYAGQLEKLANEKLIKYLKKYSTKVFTEESNVLDVLETAGEIYKIDSTQIYTFDELANKILEEYEKSIDNEEYLKILSIVKIKEGLNNLDELKRTIKMYDGKNIIAFLVYLLELPEITLTQRNQIIAVTLIKPEYFLSSVFIVAYRKNKGKN